MRRSRTFGQALTTKDWLKYHPYDQFTAYDGYYLKLAKSVFNFLNDPKGGFRQVFQRETLQRASVAITCLFEDYINEVGIWEAMKNKNKELYGWPIPFYDLSDYEPEYLNPEDYTYLLWQQLGQLSGKTLDPFADPLLIAGSFCFDHFEDHVEKAPRTDAFEQWLDIPADIPFFDLKMRLVKMTFESYLIGPGLEEKLGRELERIAREKDSLLDYMDPGLLVYALQDDFLYQKKSSWCAMSALEWLAQVARCPDSLRPDILQLSRRINGGFQYEGESEGYYHYQFLPSGRVFDICKESVDIDVSRLTAGKDMAHIGIVNWKGDWWLSGAYISLGDAPKTKEKWQSSPENANFYAWTEEQQTKIREMSAEMEETFISFFGNRLVFFANQKALAEAMQAQNAWWNEHKTKKLPPGSPKSKYAEKIKQGVSGFDEVDLGKGKIAAFFNPGEGVMMSPAVPEVIRLLEKEQLTPKESNELFYTFFSDLPPALANYILEHFPTQNLRFPFSDDPDLVKKHFDFFLRYYNPEDFRETVPKLSLLPEE